MAEREDHELTHDELILKKITRLEVGLFGIEGTDSRGLAGEIREFRASVTTITRQVTAIEARCEERHGPAGAAAREAQAVALGQVTTKRKATFVSSLVVTLAAFIYALGAWLGWWPPAPPGD